MRQSFDSAVEHHRAGRPSEAAAGCREILAREPRHAEALHLLGVIAHGAKELPAAIDLISRAIAINPHAAPFHCSLGEALRDAGDFERSISHYERAIELQPAYADAYNSLGQTLEALGQPNDARALYKQAIAIEPDHAKAHFNLGRVSLLLGDYATGWREYEWRSRLSGHPLEQLSCPSPRWDGSDPSGRTILVYCEPGLGDCIQFARYLPLLSGRGADVILVCPLPLVRLFGSLPGVCVVAEGDPPPQADFHVSIGSLPLLFATTPATIPTFSAYLRPDIRLAEGWRNRLRTLRAPGQKLVGLAWAGNPAHADDRWRSLRLKELSPLSGISGVRFVSLQKDAAAAPLGDVPHGLDLVDVSPHLHDLADTAALIAQLDLTISVDTAVAHLAGAIGKPVWTLIRYGSEWRWSLASESTSWYATMRLLRQETHGDWSLVIRDIANELKLLSSPKPASLAA